VIDDARKSVPTPSPMKLFNLSLSMAFEPRAAHQMLMQFALLKSS
jgi:hypothetical protein